MVRSAPVPLLTLPNVSPIPSVPPAALALYTISADLPVP